MEEAVLVRLPIEEIMQYGMKEQLAKQQNGYPPLCSKRVAIFYRSTRE
jgi:hypothetical protein